MIDLSVDLSAVTRTLSQRAQRQVPFATARALTATANAASAAFARVMPSRIDRPTPFTQRALAIKPARKSALEAVVYLRPAQARYLATEEFGGVVKADAGHRSIPVPVRVGLNRYGGIGRGRLAKLIAAGQKRAKSRPGRVFAGRVRGHLGVWRTAGPSGINLQLLAGLHDSVTIKPRLGMRAYVVRFAERDLPLQFRRSLSEAMRTAR